MTVQIVDVSSCKRNLVVEVPAEELEQEIDKLARDYARRVKIPGFRPGKTPLGIIKQRYRSEFRESATQDIIRRYWKNSVADLNLKPLAEPVVEDLKGEPGNPLKFTISFEVMPVVEVKGYKGIPVTVSPVPVEEAEVDKALDSLREQHAQFAPVEDGEVRDGHVVTLTVDGEFEGGGKPIHEDDVTCVIGDPETHEAFTENLRGARLGEPRSFDVKYPPRIHQKRLAGRAVHYRVVIKDIKEKHLPELNDDFAKDVGGGSLEDLRAKIKEDLVTEARRTAEKKAREDVLDEVARRSVLDVPRCLVKDELEDYTGRVVRNLARQGIDATKTSINWKKLYEEERPSAEQAVRRSLVLGAIAKQENLSVTDEDLDAEFRRVAEATNKSPMAVRAQFEKDQRVESLRERLRQNKALDFIYRNANISEG